MILRKEALLAVERRSFRKSMTAHISDAVRELLRLLASLPSMAYGEFAQYRRKTGECRKRHVDSIISRIIPND
jgi:hypothetical protein